MELHWLLGLFCCFVAAQAQLSTSDQNRFAANLYRGVRKVYKKNVVVSPISVETVLAITQSGAQGETADELRSVLSLPDNPQEISSVYSRLITSLNKVATCANKIYIQNGYRIKEDFLNNARNHFQADVENVDFSNNKKAALTINKWVNVKTKGKIRKIVQSRSLDMDTKIILVNALYLTATWEVKFDASSPQNFYITSKKSKKVNLMTKTALFNYFDSPELNAQFLELPYIGNNLSMVVVLPKDIDGLAKLENNIEDVLTAKQWTKREVYVALPKFTIENTVLMENILSDMGIKKLFAYDADLSGIAGKKGNLLVSDVIQKSVIRVDEEGTELSTATVELTIPRNAGSGIDFFATHPFLFYIQSQGTILYMGRCVEPPGIERKSVHSKKHITTPVIKNPTITPLVQDRLSQVTPDPHRMYFPDELHQFNRY